MGLADPGWAEEDHVLGFGDEGAGGEVGEQVSAQRRQVIEVEVLQGLDRREVGGADPHDGALGLAVGDLALEERSEVFLVRPVLVPGLVGELFPAVGDGGDLEHPGQVGDL